MQNWHKGPRSEDKIRTQLITWRCDDGERQGFASLKGLSNTALTRYQTHNSRIQAEWQCEETTIRRTTSIKPERSPPFVEYRIRRHENHRKMSVVAMERQTEGGARPPKKALDNSRKRV